MSLIRMFNKASFSLNKREHVKRYPYITMVVLHHFFKVFGIDITKLDEKNVKSPLDATAGESFPVFTYNAIHNGAPYLKYIDKLEENIQALHKNKNKWCEWMIYLYDHNIDLNKEQLQEVALLSSDSMTEDYIEWQLKVIDVITEIVDRIDSTLNDNSKKNSKKRSRKKQSRK